LLLFNNLIKVDKNSDKHKTPFHEVKLLNIVALHPAPCVDST